MVTLDRVSELCRALPGVTEGDRRGSLIWQVNDKTFAWERAFSKADVRRYGDDPVPEHPILAVRVADLADKEAVLNEERPGFFTIPHFDGFSAILIELRRAKLAQVKEAILDGWLIYAKSDDAAKVLGRRNLS